MTSKKNKGFTLIEMVVAFAVLGVAVFGIGGFFVSAARSYSSVSDETSLQYEAQLALNQVESMLIDSTLGVSYNYVNTTAVSDTTKYQFVEKDSEASGEAVSKVLYAYNPNDTAASLDVMLLRWHAANQAIYYKVVNVTGTSTNIDAIDVSSTLDGWDLLAEDVTAFSVDLSEYQQTKKVKIKLGFENRSKDYETTGTVVLRNDVLINEMEIQKIYQRITTSVQSTITGIELKSNLPVTVPGGSVQLFINVLGTNYPETRVEQYQWLVSKNSEFKPEDIIYNSLKSYTEMPGTYVDTSSKVLRVSADTTGQDSDFNETLWVKVIAITKDKGADDQPISYESEKLSIGVKLINDIEVAVSADTSQSYNSNLKETSFSKATWNAQKKESSTIPTVSLVPRNEVTFTATVSSSDSIDAKDKAILWSIHDPEEGVKATLTTLGDTKSALRIDPYSRNGLLTVRATLKMDSAVYVDYKVQVVDEYSVGNAELRIVPSKNTLNRGGNIDCSLLLNNQEVDNKDYDWRVSVLSSNGQEITGKPVTVNEQGGVYANYELSYDYAYDVHVTATLKNNPTITTTTKITIPKVSLFVSPTTMFSNMGDTVSGIKCTATGLEDYDIQWTMAKETNPRYFFTAWGTFNITGEENNKGEKTAKVVMGSKNDPKTNCTVKATLKNHANYQATMRIVSANVSMYIDGPMAITRPFGEDNSSIDLDVKLENASNINISVSKDTVNWEIVDAKVGTQSVKDKILNDENISLVNGNLTINKAFAPDYENQSVVLTIKATEPNYGLADTHTVTVNPFAFDISPDMILIPDGSDEIEILFSPNVGVWSLSGNTIGDGIGLDIKAGILSLPDNDKSASDNKKLTISLIYNGETKDTATLQFGFENVRNINDWVAVGRYGNFYSIHKSGYSAFDKGSVYYVRVSYGRDPEYYAFVSNTKLDNNEGKWYKRNVYNEYFGQVVTWEKSSEPWNWSYDYFK